MPKQTNDIAAVRSILAADDYRMAVLGVVLKENHAEPDDAAIEQMAEITRRLSSAMVHSDEPRFTLYDYLDAIINMPPGYEDRYAKAVKNSDTELFDCVIDMAIEKRKTYSG